jgi:hypothetical protein
MKAMNDFDGRFSEEEEATDTIKELSHCIGDVEHSFCQAQNIYMQTLHRRSSLLVLCATFFAYL